MSTWSNMVAIRWSPGHSCQWSSALCPCVLGAEGALEVLSSQEAEVALLPLTAWGEPHQGKRARLCPLLAAAGSSHYSAGSLWAAGHGQVWFRRLEEPDDSREKRGWETPTLGCILGKYSPLKGPRVLHLTCKLSSVWNSNVLGEKFYRKMCNM